VEALKGMQAQRFDHCLVHGDDLDGTVKLFREVLEFDLTERVMDGDFMVGAI
jgi:catechol 2,3-dioxygenase